jgi:hypothetical protein
MTIRIRALALVPLLTACTATPPAPPAPRSATNVSASFGKTWDAVLRALAERNIPLKTVDRSSGLVVAEEQTMRTRIDSIADCGKEAMGIARYPTTAGWSVLVQGDSVRSMVKATVRFATSPGITSAVDCSSTGKWETELEHQVRAAAEAASAR